MIQDYIFMDEDGKIVEEGGYWDDQVAEKYCELLADIHKKKISCYRHISEYEPEDEGGKL